MEENLEPNSEVTNEISNKINISSSEEIKETKSEEILNANKNNPATKVDKKNDSEPPDKSFPKQKKSSL